MIDPGAFSGRRTTVTDDALLAYLANGRDATTGELQSAVQAAGQSMTDRGIRFVVKRWLDRGLLERLPGRVCRVRLMTTAPVPDSALVTTLLERIERLEHRVARLEVGRRRGGGR